MPVPRLTVASMVTPPVPLRTSSRRPPAWQRWLLDAMYNFDRYTIDDWLGLMRDHLQRPGGHRDADGSLHR
jgi:hypothetical protein